MPSPITTKILFVGLLFIFLPMITLNAQSIIDAGFTDEIVATLPAYQAVGLTFAPDGRIFAWQKNGVVRIIKNGILLSPAFIDIAPRVNTAGDRGLIGLALDPGFATNGYVYLLYVYENAGNSGDSSPKTARLTRVQANPSNPDVALANSEVIILGQQSVAPCSQYPEGTDCMASDAIAHTVGTVKFGPDGKLYVGMGDGGSPFFLDPLALRAQDLKTYNGKILRINPDGTAPSDNPFYDGNPNSIRSKIYAHGLRSPYRFSIHPTTGEVWIGDVGLSRWEEVNRGRGKNFGWPCFEGSGPQQRFQSAFPGECAAVLASSVTAPAYTYSHNDADAAIVGGPIYTASQFPAQYQGNYFFADYVNNYLRRIVLDANNTVVNVADFATNVATPVSLEIGPEGALYYVALTTGEIRRIRYTGTTPVAMAAATRPNPAQPYTVTFSSNGSRDPGGSALTYLWEFGDGTTSTAANPTHTYVTSGVQTMTARLTVINAQGITATTAIDVIVGSRPPVATILTPTDGSKANIGSTVSFQGSATDLDETLPNSALTWNVLLHHDTHIHPGVTVTGTSGSFQIENHGTEGTYYYEIVLTVTDSAGIKDRKSVRVNPLTPTSTLPTPWVGQEVGNVAIAGSAGYANGAFTINGSGTDIGGSSDGFYFVHQPLSNNGEIKARVISVGNTATGAKAGVMIRASLDANAAYTLMSISPVEGAAFERRLSTGYGTALSSGGAIRPPYWVRLTRNGDTFSAYQSADGTNWTQVGTAVTSRMPATVFVGLAVTSNNNTALCTATFDNVAISAGPAVNVPPTISITTPLQGTNFVAPGRIAMEAIAADSDGTVRKVEFFSGAQLLHTENLAPWTFTWSNVAVGNYTVTAKATDNAGAVTTSAPVNLNVSNPYGLKGEYFDLQTLTNLKLTRTDANVNFDWGVGTPVAAIGTGEFSIRWTGKVQPRFSEACTFLTVAEGGVRLWVNNRLIIDDWNDPDTPPRERSGTITLTADQKYDIRLEYREVRALASVKLSWSSLRQAKEIIPTSRLFTP
ncbi:MAG: PQQ-dependent sugar dehydrogenase [Acidobacteria bacterium]|nr:PQQ-dependent sugar dehydrogenase [Acidobacteriota bacterium]